LGIIACPENTSNTLERRAIPLTSTCECSSQQSRAAYTAVHGPCSDARRLHTTACSYRSRPRSRTRWARPAPGLTARGTDQRRTTAEVPGRRITGDLVAVPRLLRGNKDGFKHPRYCSETSPPRSRQAAAVPQPTHVERETVTLDGLTSAGRRKPHHKPFSGPPNKALKQTTG
jgi:hypothetical protein